MNGQGEAAPVVRLSRFGNGYVLALLIAVNIVNYADRTLMSVLASPIQRDLSLSDTQMGAITGLAFALMYGIAGLALARCADRFSQTRVLVASIATWSVMCLLTAQARSFAQLFAVRLGLGIGESGASPTSYALIHNAFTDRGRPIAYALFSAGATIGIGTGVAVGSWLGAEYGWRHTMMIMAVPGLLLALLLAKTVREPKRNASERSEASASSMTVIRSIAGDRLRCALIGAYGFASFAYAGFAQWAPTFYMRVHGMTLREVGATYSLSSSAGALLGLMVGGAVIGPLQRNNVRLSLGLCAVLMLCAAAASAGAFLVADRTMSLLLFAAFGLAAGATYAPTIALFQERSPAGTRAFAAAVMLLVAIIIGQGGGPFFVGIMSDVLRAQGTAQPLAMALMLAAISLILSAVCQVAALRSAAEPDRV